MKRRKRQIVFNPDCPFDVARAISESLEELGFNGQVQALRWAAERGAGLSYPVKVQGGASYP
jgi:hypothetical protein